MRAPASDGACVAVVWAPLHTTARSVQVHAQGGQGPTRSRTRCTKPRRRRREHCLPLSVHPPASSERGASARLGSE
ncbi:hypothetical protein VE00_06468 [Pseudogymnoascus sp. WSF 3629]|nr:hypothetical protein VE00_06468 [Pseudogymnoascus sp. WSF 3629]